MSAGERLFADRFFIALRAKWLATHSVALVLDTVRIYKLKYPGKIQIIEREFSKFKKSIDHGKSLTNSVNSVCSFVYDEADLLTQKLVEVA